MRAKDGKGVNLSLNLVTSERPRQHHMDLYSMTPEENIKRLIELGATRKEWHYTEGEDYTVLEDPDGNSFCVIPKGQ